MNWILPISIGLLGSLHCVTMCGPLVMIMGVGGKNLRGVIQSLLYHFSRITIYVLLGTLVGATMQGVELFGFSQWVSLIFGGVFLIAGLIYFFKPFHLGGLTKLLQGKYSKSIQSSKAYQKYVWTGAINGLLPCGLVYVALSGATLTQSPTEGGLHMLFFGLGTLPSMLGFSILSGWIKARMSSFRTRYIVSVAYCVFGALLIIRGLGLGVPYLSPEMDVQKEEVKCCHKKTVHHE